MNMRTIKSISMEELEAAVETAVSALTRGNVKVRVSTVTQLGDQHSRVSGTEEFEVTLTIASGRNVPNPQAAH